MADSDQPALFNETAEQPTDPARQTPQDVLGDLPPGSRGRPSNFERAVREARADQETNVQSLLDRIATLETENTGLRNQAEQQEVALDRAERAQLFASDRLSALQNTLDSTDLEHAAVLTVVAQVTQLSGLELTGFKREKNEFGISVYSFESEVWQFRFTPYSNTLEVSAPGLHMQPITLRVYGQGFLSLNDILPLGMYLYLSSRKDEAERILPGKLFGQLFAEASPGFDVFVMDPSDANDIESWFRTVRQHNHCASPEHDLAKEGLEHLAQQLGETAQKMTGVEYPGHFGPER